MALLRKQREEKGRENGRQEGTYIGRILEFILIYFARFDEDKETEF